MGLFDREPVSCGICGRNTGFKGNKKYEVLDGYICQECCDKVGLMVNIGGQIQNGTGPRYFTSNGDTIKSLKNKIELKNKFEKDHDRIKFFNSTRILAEIVHINDDSREFWVDGSGEILSIGQLNNITYRPPVIFSMDGIVDVWSSSSYSERIVDTTEKQGGIGRAIIGGAIAGPTGAIIGAMTRKESTSSQIVSNSSGTVTFVQLDENGIEQTHTLNLGYEAKATSAENVIRTFMKNIEKTGGNEKSVSDELREFKSLLDDGIITQEEFDQKKKNLLGL